MMKRLIMLSALVALSIKGYSQDKQSSQLLNNEVLEKVKAMMAADEGLLDIEGFYEKTSNEPRVKEFVRSYYFKALVNAESLIKGSKTMKINAPKSVMESVKDLLPERAIIDAIPDPIFAPTIKRFNYEKENAEFFYIYNDLKEGISQKMAELGASPSYKPGGSAGSRAFELLETKFYYHKSELSEYRQDMIESSRNAQIEIAKWSVKSDHYAGSEEERRSEVAREASAYRISRAILMRMCDELEFETNLSFFKARKCALGNMAAQAALLYKNKSITKGSAATMEISEISKGLLSRIKLMLFDGNVLQGKAQIINSSFNTLIEMSRL